MSSACDGCDSRAVPLAQLTPFCLRGRNGVEWVTGCAHAGAEGMLNVGIREARGNREAYSCVQLVCKWSAVHGRHTRRLYSRSDHLKCTPTSSRGSCRNSFRTL